MTAHNLAGDDKEPVFSPSFHRNLSDKKMVFNSYLAVQFTSRRHVSSGPPDFTVGANRPAQGADGHVAPEQVRDLRDPLTRALHKAGFE
jgi:hypothetical protein